MTPINTDAATDDIADKLQSIQIQNPLNSIDLPTDPPTNSLTDPPTDPPTDPQTNLQTNPQTNPQIDPPTNPSSAIAHPRSVAKQKSDKMLSHIKMRVKIAEHYRRLIYYNDKVKKLGVDNDMAYDIYRVIEKTLNYLDKHSAEIGTCISSDDDNGDIDDSDYSDHGIDFVDDNNNDDDNTRYEYFKQNMSTIVSRDTRECDIYNEYEHDDIYNINNGQNNDEMEDICGVSENAVSENAVSENDTHPSPDEELMVAIHNVIDESTASGTPPKMHTVVEDNYVIKDHDYYTDKLAKILSTTTIGYIDSGTSNIPNTQIKKIMVNDPF